MRVQVVGGGIVGMAAARAVRAAGHDVLLVTADPPEHTTSAVAAAIWYPYLALPRAAVTRWAAAGFAALTELAAVPASGVRMCAGRELFRAAIPDPWWSTAVPHWRRLAPAELPPGYAGGLGLVVPAIDMSVHLPWLAAVLRDEGVVIEQRRVDTLAHDGADAVVNCTGLGARDLAADAELYPVRGQVVVLAQPDPPITEWLLDDTEPMTYVVPRLDTVIVGGTADAHDDDATPRPDAAAAMLARAAALVPSLARCAVLDHRVGLRPARPAVRLERVDGPGGPIIHCYGHGGAGVTLAYGCAGDVVALLSRPIR